MSKILSLITMLIISTPALTYTKATTTAHDARATYLPGVRCSLLDSLAPCNATSSSSGNSGSDITSIHLHNAPLAVIEINKDNFTKSDLISKFNTSHAKHPSGSMGSCTVTTSSGVVESIKFLEGFSTPASTPATTTTTTSSSGTAAHKNATAKIVKSDGSCNFVEVTPSFDEAPTDFSSGQLAHLNVAWPVRYRENNVEVSTSVIIVDNQEPFIYYK